MRLLTEKDFLAGLLFVALGALGLWLGTDYRTGSAAQMGPGYMPGLLCWALVTLGAFIMIRGILAQHDTLDRGRWRPITFITLAILAFALLIDTMGLLMAGAVLIGAGAFGGSEFRWQEVVILIVLLLAVCVAIFVWGLSLPVTLLPR